jgi:hypothetical protein
VAVADSLVKPAPSTGTDDILPAGDEEAVSQYRGPAYRSAADGVRRLARR